MPGPRREWSPALDAMLRARALGVVSPAPRRRWSADEDRRLRAGYVAGACSLAHRLERSPPSSCGRARSRRAGARNLEGETKGAAMRIDFTKAFTPGYRAMLGLERAVHESGLEPLLLELVKTRASQINGCAHCLDMHTKDARALGEDEMRLHVLAAWREAPFYSDRERAALAWCEALTLLPERGAPDDVYAEVERQFSEEEIAALTCAIVAINGWNRLAVGFHSSVGEYVSRHAEPAPAAAAGGS